MSHLRDCFGRALTLTVLNAHQLSNTLDGNFARYPTVKFWLSASGTPRKRTGGIWVSPIIYTDAQAADQLTA